MIRVRRFAWAASIALFAILSMRPAGALAQLTPEERQLNIDSFEFIWKKVYENHFDSTFGGLDWRRVRDELRPRVEQATDTKEARRVMIDMLSRLHQSHFAVIPAELYNNIDAPVKKGDLGGASGLAARVIDGRAIVTSVTAGSPAADARIQPGWEIRTINGEEIAPLLPPIEKEFSESPRKELYLSNVVQTRLRGAIGDTVTALFVDGRDNVIEKQLGLREPAGKKIVFGNFPPFYLTMASDTLQDGIGYFTFSCFFDPVTLMGAFNNAMQSFMEAPGIIIDVRGNPGGIAGMGMGIAGWFVEEKNLDMGTLRTRTNTLKLAINPRAQVYKGPVAILVDGLSGSASELFAGGVQGLPRIRIFGSRTTGATLPSLAQRLPNGDGFQYAFASYISRTGVELEGEGVRPDEEAQPTREALLQGRDTAIEAAIDWMRQMHYKKN